MTSGKWIIAALCSVFVAVSAVAAYAYKNPSLADRLMGSPDTPYEATFSGTTTCLPHRDTSGPTTMECALGLKTDEGFHIGLDMSAVQMEAGSGLDTGEDVTVSGLYVPVEQMSGTMGQIYDIRGVMRVSSVIQE